MMADTPLTTTSHSLFVLQKTIVFPALEYVVMRSTIRRRFACRLGGTRHAKQVISSFIFPAPHWIHVISSFIFPAPHRIHVISSFILPAPHRIHVTHNPNQSQRKMIKPVSKDSDNQKKCDCRDSKPAAPTAPAPQTQTATAIDAIYEHSSLSCSLVENHT
jgi:hypothetical protein